MVPGFFMEALGFISGCPLRDDETDRTYRTDGTLRGEVSFYHFVKFLWRRHFGDVATKVASAGSALGVAAGVFAHQHRAFFDAEALDDQVIVLDEVPALCWS